MIESLVGSDSEVWNKATSLKGDCSNVVLHFRKVGAPTL